MKRKDRALDASADSGDVVTAKYAFARLQGAARRGAVGVIAAAPVAAQIWAPVTPPPVRRTVEAAEGQPEPDIGNAGIGARAREVALTAAEQKAVAACRVGASDRPGQQCIDYVRVTVVQRARVERKAGATGARSNTVVAQRGDGRALSER